MGHVDGVKGDRFLAPAPIWETTVPVLESSQSFQIFVNPIFHFLRCWQALGFESRQDISQRSDTHDPGGKLLRAFVRVRHQVKDGIR